jgi:type IV secretory pathway TraG/TraD family ATPase VirD4
MRARWIILIILLYGWALLVGPPQSWAPYFHTPLRPVLNFLGLLIFTVFTFPGRWILSLMWTGFFDLTLRQFWDGAPFSAVAIAAFAWTFTILFSYVFWFTALSRSWKFIGRWNPFGSNAYRSRPHVLIKMAKFSNWWDQEVHFGRHATGRFASLFEVLSNEFQHGDVFLGRPKLPIGGMLRPIGIETERHMVTIAGTGAGKSTAAMVPNLCLHEGNVFCIDPKGELAALTARRRGHGGGGVRGMGDDVFVLDPFGIVNGFRTASYNVFAEMESVAAYDVNRPVSYASKLGQALVPSLSQRDPYWENAARTFITGMILHIFQGPKEHRNLVRLRTLIMEGDEETYRRVAKKGDRGDAFDALLVMMENCPDGPYRHVIVGAANTLSKMSSNQRGGVVTMATEHTSFLDVPEIRNVVKRSDFLLEDLKNKNISIYVCLPLNKVTGIEQGWLRMFVMLVVDMFVRNNKRPEPPVLVAIDEFPALGKLEGIDTMAPQMRGYGVRLWVVGQDLNQFERTYPDSWVGFIGNAAAVQFMGSIDPPTVAWLSERLGQHVVTQRQDMGGQSREISSERAVRDPDQVAKMLDKEGKNQIIWRGSKRAMLLKTCHYFDYMPWWYYSRPQGRREKWNRAIWRRGDDPVDPPLVAADEYIPKEPGVKPDDIVPGIGVTWSDIVSSRKGADVPNKGDRPWHWERRGDEFVKVPGKIEYGDIPVPKMDPDELALLKRESPALFPDEPKKIEAKEPPKMPVKKTAMEELDALIGLDGVKEQVHRVVKTLKLDRERMREGKPHVAITQHLVFTGNPGTGKTTVARIVGRIYKEIGLLKSGHIVEAQRADIIGEYSGQTAPKMRNVIDAAMGGVLFIDEAYGLVQKGTEDNYGSEAITTLVQAMEEYRDRFVVIVAGYREDMRRFVDSNPGLKSRFKTRIDFEDYDTEALFQIFLHMARGARLRLSMDAQVAVGELMEGFGVRQPGFGNARTVRNIFEECFGRMADRIDRNGGGRIDRSMFEAEDIPKPGEKNFD